MKSTDNYKNCEIGSKCAFPQWRGFWFLLAAALILGAACAGRVDSIRERRKLPKNLIIEGRGVGWIRLGDSKTTVESLMGGPDDIVLNYCETPMKFLFEKALILGGEVAHGVRIDKKNKEIFIHPFYTYYYAFYNDGLIIYFDEHDRVVTIIIFAFDCYGFRGFKGEFRYGDVTTEDDYRTAVEKYRTAFKEEGDLSSYETSGFISIKRKDTFLQYSYGDSKKLETIRIISPVIGGTMATIYFAHQEYFTEKDLAEWRRKYGKTYMRD